jgi:hypothetical protein
MGKRGKTPNPLAPAGANAIDRLEVPQKVLTRRSYRAKPHVFRTSQEREPRQTEPARPRRVTHLRCLLTIRQNGGLANGLKHLQQRYHAVTNTKNMHASRHLTVARKEW